jgi:hypothetical protein
LEKNPKKRGQEILFAIDNCQPYQKTVRIKSAEIQTREILFAKDNKKAGNCTMIPFIGGLNENPKRTGQNQKGY